MSVDTHKFGMAHKGTSVVLYRSPDVRRHQFTQVKGRGTEINRLTFIQLHTTIGMLPAALGQYSEWVTLV
jgi:glutamate/tyrosine decarboxylase-like PLP-dependent enzyme